MGNTCYMNSFLQMMYSIEGLRHQIISLDLKRIAAQNQDQKKKNLMMQALYQLQRIFVLMTAFKVPKESEGPEQADGDSDFVKSSRMFIVPQSFRKTLPLNFQSYQQQDANEFCKVLLDKLEEEHVLPAKAEQES